MTADDWTVVPGSGLGKLEFGMSPEQVDAFADIYGALEARMSDRASDDLLLETLALFGDGLSEDEKKDFIAAYGVHGPPSQSVTETRGESGLVLGYLADRLVEIMMPAHRHPLILAGEDMLSLGPAEALGLLERLNGAPGRYAGTLAAFDNLALSVDGFCVTDRVAGVRILNADDERFDGRTAVMRSTPYLPEEEFIICSVMG